jgi:tetratricopeptide (TPR) repeat protein
MAEVQLASLAAEAREAIDSEDLARAADACRRAILRFPRWVEGYWLLGHILVESGYVPQARSCFEAVASAMPDDPRAYQGLADAADQQHDIATAVAGLTRALEVGEDSQSVRAELRRLQQQAGYAVGDAVTNAQVAHARLVAGQYEEADVAAERALRDEPDRLDLLVVQAVARLFGGDRGGSEKVCRHLLDLSPDCLKALAILRYLVPGEGTAAIIADLDALDPEGRTLVWLRGQMTTLGYEADDLPATPRLVVWQEDEQPGRNGAREIRPLDRLIPELEEVWPQWLQQAAQSTPEVRPGEPPAPSEAAPPPPTFAQEEAPPSTPSFLGDVDTLAREFEDAMRPSPAGEPSAATTGAPETTADEAWSSAPAAQEPAAPEPVPPEPAAPEPVAPAMKTDAEPVDWQTPRPDERAPVAEPETAVATEPAAVPAEAPAPPADEFAQWQTPAAVSTDADPTRIDRDVAPEAAVEPHRQEEEPAAPEPATMSPATESSVQPVVGAAHQGETEAERPVRSIPAVDAESGADVEALRAAARAAIAAGDHWSAIDRYAAILATLTTSERRG